MLWNDKPINHLIIEYNKLAHKEHKTSYDWVGRGDQLGIVQESKIWPDY